MLIATVDDELAIASANAMLIQRQAAPEITLSTGLLSTMAVCRPAQPSSSLVSCRIIPLEESSDVRDRSKLRFVTCNASTRCPAILPSVNMRLRRSRWLGPGRHRARNKNPRFYARGPRTISWGTGSIKILGIVRTNLFDI